MSLEELNQLNPDNAREEFTKCCGAQRWVDQMVLKRPFDSKQALLEYSEKVWFKCSDSDWLEAFTHHPKIGNIESLQKKFNNTREWAGGEQKGVEDASKDTVERLAEFNHTYEEKFGFIFIVCATGKSAKEMLELLEERLGNTYHEELKIAMGEQNKITEIRLKKLLS